MSAFAGAPGCVIFVKLARTKRIFDVQCILQTVFSGRMIVECGHLNGSGLYSDFWQGSLQV